MKLSAKTIHILKNFTSINPSIVLREGNVLSTISPTKTIMARATVPDEFSGRYGIYNLGRFISSILLMDNPDVEFGESAATISDGNRSVVYHYSEQSLILVPPEKEIKLPTVDVEVTITNKDIQNVTKALGVLGLPEIAIVGDGSKVMLQAVSCKEASSDTYSIDIGETDAAFRAIFRAENLKMIDGDYNVKISSKGISQFTGIEATYWIAIEQTSTF